MVHSISTMPRPEISVREDDQSIGAQLRRARQSAGLTGASVAGKAGYSRSDISRAETGIAPPPPDLVMEYERILKLKPGELLSNLNSRRMRLGVPLGKLATQMIKVNAENALTLRAINNILGLSALSDSQLEQVQRTMIECALIECALVTARALKKLQPPTL